MLGQSRRKAPGRGGARPLFGKGRPVPAPLIDVLRPGTTPPPVPPENLARPGLDEQSPAGTRGASSPHSYRQALRQRRTVQWNRR